MIKLMYESYEPGAVSTFHYGTVAHGAASAPYIMTPGWYDPSDAPRYNTIVRRYRIRSFDEIHTTKRRLLWCKNCKHCQISGTLVIPVENPTGNYRRILPGSLSQRSLKPDVFAQYSFLQYRKIQDRRQTYDWSYHYPPTSIGFSGTWGGIQCAGPYAPIGVPRGRLLVTGSPGSGGYGYNRPYLYLTYSTVYSVDLGRGLVATYHCSVSKAVVFDTDYRTVWVDLPTYVLESNIQFESYENGYYYTYYLEKRNGVLGWFTSSTGRQPYTVRTSYTLASAKREFSQLTTLSDLSFKQIRKLILSVPVPQQARARTGLVHKGSFSSETSLKASKLYLEQVGFSMRYLKDLASQIREAEYIRTIPRLARECVDKTYQVSINMIEFLKDVPEFGSTVKTLAKLARNPKSLDAWRSAILSYQYGDLLTLDDLRTLWNDAKNIDWQRFSGIKTGVMSERASASSQYQLGPFVADVNTSYQMYYSLPASFYKETAATMQAFGLAPTPQSLWNLLPLSFVLDWLVDVNEFLSWNEYDIRTAILHVNGGCYSTKLSIDLVDKVSVDPDLGHDSFWSDLSVTMYYRNTSHSLPEPSYMFGLGSLTPSRIATAVLIFLK